MATVAVTHSIDDVLLELSRTVLDTGQSISSVIESRWPELAAQLSDGEIVRLAKLQLGSQASARLTSGFKSSRSMLVRSQITHETGPETKIRVRLFTETLSYRLEDGSRKQIVNCGVEDFNYLLHTVDNRIRGLSALKAVIDDTVALLSKRKAESISDLPEQDRLRIDQAWKSAKNPQLADLSAVES